MKKIIFFFLSLISIFSFSQKFLDARIIKTDNDTINSKIRIETNMFYKNMINEASFYKVVRTLNENNEVVEKIDAKDIKELKFTDLEGKVRTFVNDGKFLKELLFDGEKIKLYRGLSQNLYDGASSSNYYLIDSDQKKYGLSGKKILEATKSKPELAQDIKNWDRKIISLNEILKKYEE
jgi:hypothetical protein